MLLVYRLSVACLIGILATCSSCTGDDAMSDASTDTDSDTDTDTDTDIDTDTDTDADSGTETDSGTDTDTDTDTDTGPGGEYLWHTYYGSGSAYTSGLAIGLDSSGYVYIAGGSSYSWTGPSGESPIHDLAGVGGFYILKLSSSGAYQWHTFQDFVEGGVSDASVDSDGNVYVLGEANVSWDGPGGEAPLHAFVESEPGIGENIVIVKFDTNGNYQWHTFYGAAGATLPIIIGEAIHFSNSDGMLYLAGLSDYSWTGPAGEDPLNSHSGSSDLFVLSLDSNGTYAWHTFLGTGGASSIVADATGHLFLAGGSSVSWNGPGGEEPLNPYSGNHDAHIVSMTTDGGYLWHTFFGSGLGEDTFNSIAVDADGSIYAAGYSYASWNGPESQAPLHAFSDEDDVLVAKLDDTGTYEWHTFYGSMYYDEAFSVASDGSGQLLITGCSWSYWYGPDDQEPLNPHAGLENDDIFVLSLDSDGGYYWHTFYGDLTGNEGIAITVDTGENVYVTGDTGGPWEGPDGQAPLNEFPGGNPMFVLKLGI